MRQIALVFAIALVLGASLAPVALAASSEPSFDAPWCTGIVGVRCTDNGRDLCQVYIRGVICAHL